MNKTKGSRKFRDRRRRKEAKHAQETLLSTVGRRAGEKEGQDHHNFGSRRKVHKRASFSNELPLQTEPPSGSHRNINRFQRTDEAGMAASGWEADLARQRQRTREKKMNSDENQNSEDEANNRVKRKQLGDYVYDEERRAYFNIHDKCAREELEEPTDSGNYPGSCRWHALRSRNTACIPMLSAPLYTGMLPYCRKPRARQTLINTWCARTVMQDMQYTSLFHGQTREEVFFLFDNCSGMNITPLSTSIDLYPPWRRSFDVLNTRDFPCLAYTGETPVSCRVIDKTTTVISDENNAGRFVPVALKFQPNATRDTSSALGVLFANPEYSQTQPVLHMRGHHWKRAKYRYIEGKCRVYDLCWSPLRRTYEIATSYNKSMAPRSQVKSDSLCLNTTGTQEQTGSGNVICFGHRNGQLSLLDRRTQSSSANDSTYKRYSHWTAPDSKFGPVCSIHMQSPNPHNIIVRGTGGEIARCGIGTSSLSFCRLYDSRKIHHDSSKLSYVHNYTVPWDVNVDPEWTRQCQGMALDPTGTFLLTPIVLSRSPTVEGSLMTGTEVSASPSPCFGAWNIATGEYAGCKTIESFSSVKKGQGSPSFCDTSKTRSVKSNAFEPVTQESMDVPVTPPVIELCQMVTSGWKWNEGAHVSDPLVDRLRRCGSHGLWFRYGEFGAANFHHVYFDRFWEKL